MRRLETYDWWPELVSLKDELSLRELAEKFSVTPGAISAALKREGIGRKPAPPGPRAHRKKKKRKGRQVEEPLPPEPGEVLPGAESGARPGSKDGQIQAHAELLGKVPDREVAELAGVSVRTIASFRSRHGISAYSGPKHTSTPRKRRSRIEPFEHLLGRSSDQEIAELAGVTANAVRNYRAKRNIGSAGGARAGQQAWQVVILSGGQQLHRVVLAGSVVDAAQTATAQAGLRKNDRVVSVTWVGEML